MQRDQDTCKKTRERVSLEKRKGEVVEGVFGDLVNPSLHDFECKHMSETRRKSCFLPNFLQYWERRKVISSKQQTYKDPYFRQAKFMV